MSLLNNNRVESSIAVAGPTSGHGTKAYDAIAGGVGIASLSDRIIVRIVGDDRIPFMHGMCSNDITGLAIGAVAPALILTEHAHIIADFFVYAEAAALLIEIDRELWPKTRAHLEKFLVADDVEFEELENLGVIDLEGPGAGQLAAMVAGGEPLQPWHHAQFDDLRCANLPRFGGPAFTLLVERAQIASTIETLSERGRSAGVRDIAAVDAETLEILRVEHGVARVGVDTTEKTIALEARLEDAISFNKGCYLGQETIERATARGGLKKKLFGLRIESNRSPAAGSAIMVEGKEVGRLTSVAKSPRLGIIGLSILHHSAWAAGTPVAIVDVAGETVASVCELPFA